MINVNFAICKAHYRSLYGNVLSFLFVCLVGWLVLLKIVSKNIIDLIFLKDLRAIFDLLLTGKCY